ncbi:hypothetical protein DV515_00015264 [Chloebia gouldiae]|uniref:Uncharacterized protein n=1 Tax=Chloebia gouldiae TaxID=44316 RepID=A0A3L8RW02_CHLGU|nr:hypothetical protein DV515_00015264 [Chloebia gouldiae]
MPPLEQTITAQHSMSRTQKSPFSNPLHFQACSHLAFGTVILGAAMGNRQGGEWTWLSPELRIHQHWIRPLRGEWDISGYSAADSQHLLGSTSAS